MFKAPLKVSKDISISLYHSVFQQRLKCPNWKNIILLSELPLDFYLSFVNYSSVIVKRHFNQNLHMTQHFYFRPLQIAAFIFCGLRRCKKSFFSSFILEYLAEMLKKYWNIKCWAISAFQHFYFIADQFVRKSNVVARLVFLL